MKWLDKKLAEFATAQQRSRGHRKSEVKPCLWPWVPGEWRFWLLQLETSFSLATLSIPQTCSIPIVWLAISRGSSEVSPEPCYALCWWRSGNRLEIEFLNLSNMDSCQESWISTYFLIVSWEWMAVLITGDAFCCVGQKMRQWQLGCVGGWCCSWQETGNQQKSGKEEKKYFIT